jgi:hypothetical protein
MFQQRYEQIYVRATKSAEGNFDTSSTVLKCLLFPDSELEECHVVTEHRVSHHHVNLKEH